MKNETREKIFDLILADALAESLDIELRELSDSREYDNYKFPADFERNIRKIRNSIGKKYNIKKCADIFVRLLITAAAIMGIIFGGLLTRPSVYAAVENAVRTIFDKYDKYDYFSDELTVDNFNDNIRLGYVPDGYFLSSGNYSRISVSLTYVNENENKIMLDYGIADGTSRIYDNEHSSFSSFKENGNEYYYYESNDNDYYNTLVWWKDGYDFSLLAQFSKDELVKIAENIK